MLDNVLKSHAFKLKGRIYTLTVLQVLSDNLAEFADYLSEVISKAPKLFEHTPMVLDFSNIQQEEINLQMFCQVLRAQGIIPVAVQGVGVRLQAVALANGLAVFSTSLSQEKPVDAAESSNHSSEVIRSKLLTSPVRSGQQIVSKGSDLVILASVSHGAELLADGNIHIYGALRGRALAGIDGNTQARIFCQLLDAELVSIAGFYRLRDAIEPPEGPCQIFLQDGHIHVEPL